MNNRVGERLKLSFNHLPVTLVGVDSAIGKQNVKHLHADANYLSNPQFRLVRRNGVWMIEHCASATNDTIVDGSKLAFPLPIRDGMIVSVGNARKGIIRFPIVITVVTGSHVDIEAEPLEELSIHMEPAREIAARPKAGEVCDFCGATITNTRSMVRFADGRARCQSCCEQGVDSQMDATMVCREAMKIMRSGLLVPKFSKKIPITFVSAEFIARRNDIEFVATEKYDSRIVGLASYRYTRSVWGIKNGEPNIYIEHGFSRMDTLLTVVHEVTHIWQYETLDMDGMDDLHAKLVREGHACWAEIAAGRLARIRARTRSEQLGWAETLEARLSSLERDEGIYGRGYRLLTEKVGKKEDGFKYMLNAYGRKKPPRGK